MENKAVII